MHYYAVALIGLHAPILSYSFNKTLRIGTIVYVKLKGKIKKAVILKEVQKPEFKTLEIENVINEHYKDYQLDIAKFISSYYFSSFGEAIALFIPFKEVEKEESKIKLDNLPILTKLQEKALKEIEKEQQSLLFGVTGSGKTEIYIHLIAKALKENKDTILLMPEIALTPQITKRIEKHFGSIVATWHSKITKKRKEEILNKIRSGKIKVLIGARSALFLPFKNLGLIIVDEEHDDSYKAFSRPRYNAKDLALFMAKKLNIKVLLASATPLVSDYYKFKTIYLKKPYKEAKKEFKFLNGEEIDFNILKEIKDAISKDEQALIFVPTRANFKYLICNNCGKSHICPFCSIGMSIHSKKRVSKCHYCNYATKIPTRCEFCGSEDLITNRIGTAEVINLISNEIEDAKIIQFDKDAISTANKLYKAIEKINKKEANVIVGTQMLSKGHDYPEITLSVITGLDYILATGDYRAKERAIALLHQIAGRSGRSKDAKVLIKSSQEEFYKEYLKDYEIFIKEELKFREELYPPFKNLARVLIANRDYQKGLNLLKEIESILKQFKNIQIVGAAAAPIEKIANKWRFNILLRSDKKIELLKALNYIRNYEVEIDMDPVDFS